MQARNTESSFGWVTRALHWLMTVGIIVMLAFGTYLGNAEPSLALIPLYGLHKSIGLVLLTAVILRIIWHRYSPPPAPHPNHSAPWTTPVARAVRWLLYALMLLMPLSGWVASAATGLDVVVFNTVTLPQIAPTSELIENVGFAIHAIAGKALMATLVLHIAGAIMHQFVWQDGTLARMSHRP